MHFLHISYTEPAMLNSADIKHIKQLNDDKHSSWMLDIEGKSVWQLTETVKRSMHFPIFTDRFWLERSVNLSLAGEITTVYELAS